MIKVLKHLENKIAQKNRELDNLENRHQLRAQGNTNYHPYRINRHTYTNANYLKNVTNAMRILKEHESLFKAYNKASEKFRQNIGLPALGAKNSSYRTLFFRRVKRENQRLPSTPGGLLVLVGWGTGFGAHYKQVQVNPRRYSPNVQLVNALLKRSKALGVISKATTEALYHPRFVSGSFVGRRVRNTRNSFTGTSRHRSPIRNIRKKNNSLNIGTLFK